MAYIELNIFPLSKWETISINSSVFHSPPILGTCRGSMLEKLFIVTSQQPVSSENKDGIIKAISICRWAIRSTKRIKLVVLVSLVFSSWFLSRAQRHFLQWQIQDQFLLQSPTFFEHRMEFTTVIKVLGMLKCNSLCPECCK